MEVGLALPQFDFSVPGESPIRWPTVVRWAQRAEGLGFDSVWVADHLFLPLTKYGGPSVEYGGFDPLVALGGLSRATSRVRLGTLVLCAQLRPPAVTAKALATIDVLSGGRVVAGLGAGWLRREVAGAGIPLQPLAVRLRPLGQAHEIVLGRFRGG